LITSRPDPAERPDPGTNLIEYLRWLGDRVEALFDQQDGRRMSASEAARELGYNARYFHGHPWRVPGFGLKGMMHSLQAWREWNDRPEAERRATWDAMPAREQAKARGVMPAKKRGAA
jgi:hypothetical protein